MGAIKDKAKGYANEAAGSVKEVVGKATGNTKVQAKGVAQKVKGEAQVALGKAESAMKR